MTRGRAFYEFFWLTPAAPVPSIDGELISPGGFTLGPELHAARTKLQASIASLNSADERHVQEAIALCDQYSSLLRQNRELIEPGCACAVWRSGLSSETAELPFELELPMVVVTKALLTLSHVRTELVDRTHQSISVAVSSLQNAAGLFEHAISLIDRPPSTEQDDDCSFVGSASDSAIPELSQDILSHLSSLCCAIAQQLAIVKAVLHFDMPYSRMVLLKLHGGCETTFREFEDDTDGLSGPLVAFAAFFSRLHGAQAFELAGELEYMDASIGEAIAYTSLADQCFRMHDDANDLSLPSLSTIASCVVADHSDRFEPRMKTLLNGKRTRLTERERKWRRENDSSHFALIPPQSELLKYALPQAMLMKPRVFRADGTADSTDSDAEDNASESGSESEESDTGDSGDAVTPVEPLAESERPAPVETTTTPIQVMAHHGEASIRAEILARHGEGSIRAENDNIEGSMNGSSRGFRRSTAPAEEISGAVPLPTIQTLAVVPERLSSLNPLIRRSSVLEREAQAAARVRRELVEGKRVWRLNKHRKWAKETLTLRDSGLVFTRKKRLIFIKTQTHVHWVSVSGMQFEYQGHGNSRVQSTHEKHSTSILLVTSAPRGESKTFEFTTNEQLENSALFAVLQQDMLAARQPRTGPLHAMVLVRQNTVS